MCVVSIFFHLGKGVQITANDSTVRCLSPGVEHSLLRQVGEGLSGVRTGAGAPVDQAVYRGGTTSTMTHLWATRPRFVQVVALGLRCVFPCRRVAGKH